MSAGRRRSVGAVLLLVALLLPASGWVGAPGHALPLSPSAVSGHLAPTLPPNSGSAAPTPAGVHPAILCPSGFASYGPVGVNSVWPITMGQILQVPCIRISVDEEHATFSSSAAESGQRWTIPIHLPVDGSTYQADSYAQFYVGMVVAGNALSEWKQSYAAVVFTPNAAPVTSWSESVHVFALLNTSHHSGNCPSTSLAISWNYSFYCEDDDVTNASAAVVSNLAPGDWLNVTFAGDKASSAPVAIWVNDSTTPSGSSNATLNSTFTGAGSYSPFYDAACPDTCMLQWSIQANFGLGIGFTLCPFTSVPSTCNSYNDLEYNGTNPPEFGIPHFWSQGGYNGDYRYFAPVSASGVCNQLVSPGLLANCWNQNSLGGTGYYPSFSYNGSVMDFGVTRSWTTNDFGGSVFELLSTGAPNDLTPFYFYTLQNDSHAGFAPSGASINVTTNLQDYGNVRSAGVTYRVNGGAPVSVAMSRTGGTLNDGTWHALIPSGPDGWVNFTVNATNNAGATLLAPSASGAYHIQRGPLPTFTVDVGSSLSSCGGVRINGALYSNGAVASLQPGTYSILGVGCYPYVFSGWSLSPGISVSPTGAQSGTVTIAASGSITAHWTYVRPLDTVRLYTNPSSCGQIVLGGQGYFPPSGGQDVQVLDDTNTSLGVTGCGSESFSGWNFTGNFTILGNNFVANGNGSLYANFVSSTSSFIAIFHTNPSTCGGVAIRGAGYTDGQSLSLLSGTYSISPDPCFHWGFSSWSTTGGLSVSGGTLTVTGSGTVTENNYVLTIVTFATSPPGCGYITFDGVQYTGGEWVVVQNNSTHSVFASPCAGTYLFSITGTDGVSVVGNVATVTGSGTVTAVFLSGAPTNFVAFLTDPATCGAIYFSGVRYTSSNFTYVATGTVATISAQPCGLYGFVKWVTFGDITIVNSTAYINGYGAIEAVFRPLASLTLYTQPAACGSISIAGTAYPSNTTLTLTENVQYPVVASPCEGYAFSSWVNTSSAILVGGTVSLVAGAILTAIFLPVKYSVAILVSPAKCGGVRVAGQTVGNGTMLSLSHASYSISAVPCTGDHLVRWGTTGNLSVVNTTLWVNGTGSVSALFQPVPPSLILYVSSSSYAGIAVPFGVAVAVLVPPYTYNYTWNFGDGPPLTTPVNFTSHTYAQPGRYLVSVSVVDPYNRTANASATIQVVAQSATQLAGLTPLALLTIGLAIAAVLAVIVIGSRLRRTPPEPLSAPMPTPPVAEAPGPDSPDDSPPM